MANENKEAASSLDSVFGGASESSSSTEGESAPASTESKEESSPADGDSKESSQDEGDESKESETPSDKPNATEEKPGEKPAADKKEDKPTEKPAESKDAKKDEGKSQDELTFQKRFEDTHKWANELNQQNSQLRQIAEKQQQQIAILQKKVDGTWTEEDEAALHKGESTEDVATRAVQVGKGLASRAAAIREASAEFGGDVKKGTEKVNGILSEFKQLFGDNDIVKAAVAQAESPVHEAMAVVARYNFHQKYGQTPAEIHANITKEAVAAKEKELRKSILDEIRAGKSKAKETPETLATVNDSGHASGKVESTDALDKIFG